MIALGYCIVCDREYGVKTPAEIHHLVSGSKRLGERYTILLCPGHHRNQEAGKISRHSQGGKRGGKSAFEAAYGSEQELLRYQDELVKQQCLT